ncbi:MAG: ABC transporter substrate-binding protein [bacterium]
MGKKALVVSCFLFLVSCHSLSTDQYGGKFTIGDIFTPTEINPITTDSSISANLLDLIFDTLVKVSSDGKIEPQLAEKWEVSPDQKQWTFYLRKDVLFHDGTPLKAEDVVFTLETLKKSERVGHQNALAHVQEIRVLDPYTVRLTLTRLDNTLWGRLGMYGVAPKRLLEQDPKFTQFNLHPIGSGPYKFERQSKNEIVLKANESYFAGRPYLDEVKVEILPSQTSCLSHLIAGKIDMIFLLNPEDYGSLSQIPSIKIYNNWDPVSYMIVYNMRNPLFESDRVRRALNLAVNRRLIFERVLKGKGEVMGGVVLGPAPSSGDGYDPKKAVQMLKEAGWEKREGGYLLTRAGKEFKFTITMMKGDEVGEVSLRLIQEELLEVGVKVSVSILPFDEYVSQVFRKRNFDAVWVNTVLNPLLGNDFSFWHSSQIESGLNFASYRNSSVDRSLEEGRFSSASESRKAATEALQKALAEDPPGIHLFLRKMPIAVQSRFQGIPEQRMESFRDLIKVWVPKSEQVPRP